MHDTDMTRFELSLASRLRAHSDIDVAPANALAIARETMTARRRSGFAASWGSLRAPMRAAIVLALISSLVVGAVLVGSQLLRVPDTVVLPRPTNVLASDTPASTAPIGGPAAVDLRSRWLAFVDTIPGIGNGAGPVTLTIDSTGGQLAIANLAPGASFSSAASMLAQDEMKLTLVDAGSGCAAGAAGSYRVTQSPDGARLTFDAVDDECVNRSLALSRAWDRTLVGPTTVGAGVVDSMQPNFAIQLPDDRYESRTLDDFIEIGSASGLTLLVFKNPQGFVDACSTDEVRYPYTPGAAAFVEYYRQNDAFEIVEETLLTIDGHNAVHLVTKVKVEGARCPGTDLYALTPRACNCHFFGGDDSLYLIDVGDDTFLFQLSPTPEPATELAIMTTIRIPFQAGQSGP